LTNYKYKYTLNFLPEALEEWNKVDKAIRNAFKKMLEKRLDEPCRPNLALRGLKDCYKLKLRDAGFRLVYHVKNTELIVTVISVGKREDNIVYELAKNRLPLH
jgi:mRNA interferase RelE/StbE